MFRIQLICLIAFCFTFLIEASLSGQTRQDLVKESVALIGAASIAGDSLDLSDLSEVLIPESGTTDDVIAPGTEFTNNMLGGISAIAWTGEGDRYWCLPDRGPLDGAVDWSCRVHQVRISINSEDDQHPDITTELVSTVLLKDKRRIPYTGLASSVEASETHTSRLDPEGIRVGDDGNLFISDEYGPRLIEFSPNGEFIREFRMPNRLLVENPDVSKPTENPKNVSGRQSNRGMEGLAIAPDGKRLFGLMQSPLLQDSFRMLPTDKPTGLNCRLPVFETTGECCQEYVYSLDDGSNKLNEILACDSNSFIAIERDGLAGEEAQFKKLVLVSVADASDVRSVEKLPPRELDKEIKSVSKRVLIDLLDPKWNLAGTQMPEKIEGLAFGPDFSNGDRLLLVASDNDFIRDNATMIYLFRVPEEALVFDGSKKVSAISR